jgi:putative oxidoreductase
MAIALQPISDAKGLASASLTHAAASLVARAMMAAIFLASGVPKLMAFDAAAKYMAGLGVSPQLLPFVIAIEIGGGVAILLGLFTRWAALALALLAVATAVVFHRNLADDAQMIEFMKNIAIGGGLILLAANGPGRWALLRD